MSLEIESVYTDYMIKSEESFLKHLDIYKNNPILKQIPNSRLKIGNCSLLDFGPNCGEKVPLELKERIENQPNINLSYINYSDYQTDTVVVGSGGAGLSAAIKAAENGANVLVLTKGNGCCNTALAQGGIQAATEDDDSPKIHFDDTMRGGHYKNKEELVKKLANEAPDALQWLIDLGVEFEEKTLTAGGITRNRLHTKGDKTGAAIMKSLLKRVAELKDNITILKYANVKKILIDDSYKATGVVFEQSGEYKIVNSKAVILATGGSGSLRYNNFSTSNCIGSTADGLALAYNVGAKLVNPGDIQYHPTGGVWPAEFSGKLISEKARSLGALLFNAKGEALQSLGNRDDIVKLILSEQTMGNAIETPDGEYGLWLATPMIDKINGTGTIESKLPGLFQKYRMKQIDIREHAILVYPTVHYHLGGIAINTKGMTSVRDLFAVGEVSGGIDGENRLMGNALAAAIVYGCTAGCEAAKISKQKIFSKKLIDGRKII